MRNKKISIVGTVGIPAKYGGFETLVENLVKYHHAASLNISITVYCSGNSYPAKYPTYLAAELRYIPLNANGAQSILYDIVSLISVVWYRSDVILLLGVSGAIALPLVRLFSSARIITNIDGIEWRREKWQGFAKWFLRFSEKIAVRFSHQVVSDNAAIALYVKQTYGVDSHVIAYGGDHALVDTPTPVAEYNLPNTYAFSVCRIEPENNVHMVVEAFAKLPSHALVMVGNWNSSEYGRSIRQRYVDNLNLYLLDAVYDLSKLNTLRKQASFYVHGHSAGGTNPSLVEAMHFGKAVLAFDCDYNRSTTEDKALFFNNAQELMRLIESINKEVAERVGLEMLELAQRRYTWDIVAKQYFALMIA